jgi:hypothetical protein
MPITRMGRMLLPLSAAAVVASFGIGVSPAAAAQGPTTTLHINEILHNPEGGDTPNEYLEIKGTANATVPNCTYVVFIESSGTTQGDVQEIFTLSNLTLGSDGFLVFLQSLNPYQANTYNPATNPDVSAAATIVVGTTNFTGIAGYSSDNPGGIENEAYTALMIRSQNPDTTCAAPSLTLDVDPTNNATFTLPATWTVLDGIAALEPGPTGVPYGATAICNDGEWVGRPTTDPSGMDQDAWVCSPFDNGDTAPFTLGAITAPVSYAGLDLNHVGSANWPLPPPDVPEAPWALLLPGSALVGVGGFLLLRRRSAARALV